MKIKIIFFLILGSFFFNLSANSFLEQAFSYHKERKLDRAEISYLKALESGANETIVSYNLANLYYQKGEISRAIPLYQKVIERAPKFKNAYLNLGKIFFINEEYVKALKIFLDFYRLVPEDWDNLVLIGDTFKRMEINEEAFKFYNEALQLEPNNENSYIILSEFYLNLLDENTALYYLDLAEKNQITSAKIKQLEGDIYFENEAYFKAIHQYEQLLNNKKFNLTNEEEYSVRSKIIDCLLWADISQLAINNLKLIITDYGRLNDLIKLEELFQKKNKLKESFDFYLEQYTSRSNLVYPFIKNLFILAYNQENTQLINAIINFYDKNNLRDEIYDLVKYDS